MMEFLKKIFNDEDTIVGLCGFDNMKPDYRTRAMIRENLFNHLDCKKTFETNFATNTLLL